MKSHKKIMYIHRKESGRHAVNGLDTFSSHKFSETKNYQTFQKMGALYGDWAHTLQPKL